MGAIDFSVNKDLLSFLHRTTKARCFVETGTFQGDSLAIAADIFPECFSVEISPVYYESAKKRFASNGNITIEREPSPDFLRRHSQLFNSRPTLFWLDAHWCAAEHTTDEDSQSPLIAELEALDRLHPESTVLIDDARLYLSPPPKPHRVHEWPSFHEVVATLMKLGPTHRLMIYNDVIVFYPGSAASSVLKFAHAHGTDWLAIKHAAERYSGLHGSLRKSIESMRDELRQAELSIDGARSGWFPWFLNPAVWDARSKRDKLRLRVDELSRFLEKA